MQGTPLWTRWSVRHVVTHRDGSPGVKILRFLRGLGELWLRLVLRPPALVHIHTSASGSFARKAVIAWSARCRGVAVVLHVHDGTFADYYRGLSGPARRGVRATLEMADVVIALGPAWAGHLREIVPKARIEVVPNAVPGSPPPHERTARHGELFVLFLGRLGDGKGIPELLEAWPRVLASLPPGLSARLVAAGDGEVERFRSVAAACPPGSVEMPGWVSTEAVEALLFSADVLVLPSWREGQPMSVLEAMSHGVAVVATSVGGIPDLLGEDAGILVPPGDVDAIVEALASVLADPDRRAAMGRAGRRRIREELSVEETWKLLDRLYEELAR